MEEKADEHWSRQSRCEYQTDVNDVTYSLIRKISYLSRFMISAAKDTATVSGGCVILCSCSLLGTFCKEAHLWQLGDTPEITLSK